MKGSDAQFSCLSSTGSGFTKRNKVNITLMVDLRKQRSDRQLRGRSNLQERIEYGRSPCKYSWKVLNTDVNREPEIMVSAKLKCGSPRCVAQCQEIPLYLTVLRKQNECIWEIDQEKIAIGYYPKESQN